MKAVSSGLPDALELLAICVEAGLSLDSGLQNVSRELKGAQPALAEELALTWAELRILLMQLEERANRLPALLTIPVMLLIMPTIFMIVGGPAVLRLMDIFAHKR